MWPWICLCHSSNNQVHSLFWKCYFSCLTLSPLLLYVYLANIGTKILLVHLKPFSCGRTVCRSKWLVRLRVQPLTNRSWGTISSSTQLLRSCLHHDLTLWTCFETVLFDARCPIMAIFTGFTLALQSSRVSSCFEMCYINSMSQQHLLSQVSWEKEGTGVKQRLYWIDRYVSALSRFPHVSG